MLAHHVLQNQVERVFGLEQKIVTKTIRIGT